MVLEMKVPHGESIDALAPLMPVFLSYVLSFVYLGIYWNNHHHLLHATTHVNGTVLWANLHLLFWLSLVPFSTRWIGESGLAPLPTALYGGVLLLSAIAYTILVRAILACQPPHSVLATAIGSDFKGNVSLVLYAAAIPLTLLNPLIAVAIFALVALMWLVPDRRIEARLTTPPQSGAVGE